MTRDEQIVAAIEHYQRRFRLGDWDIRYDPDNGPLDKDELAHTQLRGHQKAATMRIDAEVVDEHIARVVVHELMHIVLLEWSFLAGSVITKQKGGNLGVIEWLSDGIERICEQVAEAMTGVQWKPYRNRDRRGHAPFVTHQEDTISGEPQ